MEAAETNKINCETEGKKNPGGLSGSTLKLIAIFAMLIDHTGAVVLGRYLMAGGYMDMALSGNVRGLMAWLQENASLYMAYTVMRAIGRIAFPIFAFLLIEGFERTKNQWKYALRLGGFALLSEIPFDLALRGKAFDFSYQNVYFTLFLALLVMMAFAGIGKRRFCANATADGAVKVIARGSVLVSFCAIASWMNTDYAAIGILCIMALYIFRKRKPLQITAGCIAFLWELTAPLAFLPIGFYNGQRGLRLKYVFYAFYPLHLLLLYLISVALGMGAYPAL